MLRLFLTLLLCSLSASSALGMAPGGIAGAVATSGGAAPTLIIAQDVAESTVDLATYSWGQSFTVSSATAPTITVKVNISTAGATCSCRLSTQWDMTSVYSASVNFTPQNGWNSFTLNSGVLSPGVYMIGMVCDSGSAYRANAGNYSGGDYRFSAGHDFNFGSDSDREWTFEVYTP